VCPIRSNMTAALLVALLLSPPLAAAQPEAPRMYGQSAPFTVDQLPRGQLRSILEALPLQTQARALQWLHGFDFPENRSG
jgi:hypothetical protein